MTIEHDIPLSEFTTFRIGGAARFFAHARSLEDLRQALAFAREKNIPYFILGGGSNLLVSDDGFPGLVIRVELRGVSSRRDGDDVLVEAAAGESWDALVDYAVANDLQGIENLSGIPGTVGGAPVQNIGAYGSEVSSSVETVSVVDAEDGGAKELSRDDCRFAYRTSIFNTSDRGRYIVAAVTLRLRPRGAPALSYDAIAREFEGKAAPTLREVREAVLAARKKRGTLAGTYQNAGSFFKNAVVDDERFEKIRAIVLAKRAGEGAGCCPDPWHWELGSGEHKVAAACLVHCAGFPPGTRDGDAGTSPQQTLAVTNFGRATARDIRAFAGKIAESVRALFGVELEIEPVFVGMERLDAGENALS